MILRKLGLYAFFSMSEPISQCVKKSDVQRTKDDSAMGSVNGEESGGHGCISKNREEENVLTTHTAFSKNFTNGKQTKAYTPHASKETKNASTNLILYSTSKKRGRNDPEQTHKLQPAGDNPKLCNLKGREVRQISAKKRRKKS